ncbi:MAG TPA: hypothetical protein VJN67_03915 [Stellaceae bacterium]|nr:hypothetical protein [Stellaceae bacterium]
MTEIDQIPSGTKLLLVWHEIENEVEGDLYRFIGAYSSVENARRDIARLRGKPGFEDTPENFRIYNNTVDHIGWPEGFVKWSANDPDGTLGLRPKD